MIARHSPTERAFHWNEQSGTSRTGCKPFQMESSDQLVRFLVVRSFRKAKSASKKQALTSKVSPPKSPMVGPGSLETFLGPKHHFRPITYFLIEGRWSMGKTRENILCSGVALG